MLEESAGLHILMDARVSDPAVFTKETLSQLFLDLTTALEMKPLDEIQVYEVPVNPEILQRVKDTGVFEDEGGISTILAITTSHLSLHAWPLQKYFALDTFSCKDFNAELAMGLIRSRLGVTAENTLVIKRRKPFLNSEVKVVRYVQA